ncbi:MAG TPA: S8 family peptidase, partial [Candidatus Binatia bacterium]
MVKTSLGKLLPLGSPAKTSPIVAAAASLLLVMVWSGSVFAQAPGPAERPEFVPDEILVKYLDGTDVAEIRRLEGREGSRLLSATRRGRVRRLRLRLGMTVEAALARFGSNPRVKYAEPNYILHADVTPTDPRFGELWGLHNTGQSGGASDADIDAPEAWELSTGSSDVIIAIIDTGAQVAPGFSGGVSTHPDLAANLWVNPGETPGDGIDNDGNGYVDDIHGWNFFDNRSWLFYSASEDGHGTHVAGTIAADADNGIGVAGVNWQAQVMVLKFIGPAGGYTSDAIEAIEYASDKRAQVISASWGGGGFSQALKDAIEACNCVFVAAAGNDGVNTDSSAHYPSSYDSPNLIAVAATDRNDNLASFSNYGATSVDLGAPGVSILSTVPMDSYASWSGTSMATPHVSGV